MVARVGECCRCECARNGVYGWVQLDCPPQYLTNEFASLGMLQILFILGTPPGFMVCDS